MDLPYTIAIGLPYQSVLYQSGHYLWFKHYSKKLYLASGNSGLPPYLGLLDCMLHVLHVRHALRLSLRVAKQSFRRTEMTNLVFGKKF